MSCTLEKGCYTDPWAAVMGAALALPHDPDDERTRPAGTRRRGRSTLRSRRFPRSWRCRGRRPRRCRGRAASRRAARSTRRLPSADRAGRRGDLARQSLLAPSHARRRSGPRSTATTSSAYGVAPTAASTSGSANAASPSIRSEPGQRHGRAVVARPFASDAHACSGPPEPLIDCRRCGGLFRICERVGQLHLQPAIVGARSAR